MNTTTAPHNLPIVNRINQELRPALALLKPELAAVLPPHITPDKMIRFAITACQDTPKLLECERSSLFRAIMTAAVLGLEVDTKIGQSYILPFYDRGTYKAQFIPGYKGYITLAANSGFTLSAKVVREGDDFDYEYGTNQFLRHKPAGRLTGKERGEIIGAYARAFTKEGTEVFKVLELEDIYAARDVSASYKAYKSDPKKKTPWIDNPAPMYEKTAIRALGPSLPLNVQKAAQIEGQHEFTGREVYIRPEDTALIVEGDGKTYESSQQPDLMEELDLKRKE